jgi:hypothetical protein
MSRRHLRAAFVAAIVVFSLMTPALATAGDGAANCHDDAQKGFANVSLAFQGVWERGTRATIEGQPLRLCYNTTQAVSGSFQWAAVGDVAHKYDIVQVGYGHCLFANGANCNGLLYYYWAWGGNCGGIGTGPTPFRIGPALSNPPANRDYYVIRENIGGTYYYSGYVGGVLLQGLDATGVNRVARVPASSICWDSDSPTRVVSWFGETWDQGDAIGGWDINLVKKHLDYTSMRYSVNTGWLTPPLQQSCFGSPSIYYSCTVVTADHIYIDTIDR